MTDKIINFRVDENLKNAFELIAKNNDLTTSQMLRAFMRDSVANYMKNNAQQSLLVQQPAKQKKEIKQKSVIPNSWRKE